MKLGSRDGSQIGTTFCILAVIVLTVFEATEAKINRETVVPVREQRVTE